MNHKRILFITLGLLAITSIVSFWITKHSDVAITLLNSKASSTPVTTRGGNTPVITRTGYDYVPSIMVENGVYKMWWCAVNTSSPGGDAIYYATASNPAGPWSAALKVFWGSGANSGKFDTIHTCDPSVIKINNTYYMYYGGFDNNYNNADGATNIGLATSTNGTTWTRTNSGNPIIRAKRTPGMAGYIANSYGAGQPTITYAAGWFYIAYTDDTGDTAKLATYAEGRGAIYVLRSLNPTFLSGVEELTGPATFTPYDPARHTVYSLMDAASIDWQYDPDHNLFVIATGGRSGYSNMEVLLKNELLRYTDAAIRGELGEVRLDVSYTEGPGIASTPDRHARFTPSGLLTADIVRSVGTQSDPQTWNLAYVGADIQIQGSITVTPAPSNSPQGSYDAATCTVSTGWACDADDFAQPVTVHFYTEGTSGLGTYLGQAVANEPREAQVASLCGGNANHGFRFDTPASLRDGQAHTITAYAINVGGGTNPTIPQPRQITCTATPTATPTPTPTSTPTSSLPNVNLTANGSSDPITLAPNGSQGSLTFTWSSTNATSCIASKTGNNAWITGPVAINQTGYQPWGGAGDTGGTFTIACTGPGGTGSDTVSVNIQPTATPTSTATATPTNTSTPVATRPGDVDADGDVDIFDFNLLIGHFGESGSNVIGDIDSNGTVDIFDFNILVTNFGT